MRIKIFKVMENSYYDDYESFYQYVIDSKTEWIEVDEEEEKRIRENVQLINNRSCYGDKYVVFEDDPSFNTFGLELIDKLADARRAEIKKQEKEAANYARKQKEEAEKRKAAAAKKKLENIKKRKAKLEAELAALKENE